MQVSVHNQTRKGVIRQIRTNGHVPDGKDFEHLNLYYSIFYHHIASKYDHARRNIHHCNRLSYNIWEKNYCYMLFFTKNILKKLKTKTS